MQPREMPAAVDERWALLSSDVHYFEDERLNDAFNNYLLWRKKEMRWKVTPTIIQARIKILQGLSVDDAIAAIEYNMANSYQGFFLPKPTNNGQRTTEAPRLDSNSIKERAKRFDY